MPKSKVRPEIVKIGNDYINFAALYKNTLNDIVIKENNEKLFELLNPENKLSKTRILDGVLKYSHNIKDVLFDKITFYNFMTCLRDLSFQNEKPNAAKIKILKDKCKSQDPILLNKVRLALIADIGIPVVVKFTDTTVGPVDFYFDSTKEYSDDKIQGIVVGDNGFINKNLFVLTAFVNMKYIVKTLFDMVNNPSTVNDLGIFNNETFDKFSIETSLSLCAAYIRDDSRIVMTEKFMLMMKLLTRQIFSNFNTAFAMNKYRIYDHEDSKKLIKEFTENNINTIRSIVGSESENELSFTKFYDIIQLLDITPLDLLSLLEPNNDTICTILQTSLGDKLHKNISNYKFASSRFIILNKKDEDKFYENTTVYDTILVGRLLPLVYFIAYYLQNGFNLIESQKIIESLENFCHSTYLASNDGSNRLAAIHENNDNFYKSIRDFVANPLNNTPVITDAINSSIFRVSKEVIKEENKPEDENNVSDRS